MVEPPFFAGCVGPFCEKLCHHTLHGPFCQLCKPYAPADDDGAQPGSGETMAMEVGVPEDDSSVSGDGNGTHNVTLLGAMVATLDPLSVSKRMYYVPASDSKQATCLPCI